MTIDEKIRKISCGNYHNFLLKNNGELFVWGDNKDGQLGLGDNESRNKPTLLMKDEKISKISCGFKRSMTLK